MKIFTMLTVLFTGLKLTGFIDWSWWLVFSPTITQIVLWIILIVIAAKLKS